METETMEALSAFVDGEATDTEALTRALMAPGAPQVLVDFIRLREALATDLEPAEGFGTLMRARMRGRGAPRVLRLLVAAAVLALAALGALDLGRQILPERSLEPPTPARVVELQWTEVGPTAEPRS